MKARELLEQLTRLLEEDAYRGDAEVVFGPEEGDNVPIEGGIMAKNVETGLVSLILAPVKLNQVGGF